MTSLRNSFLTALCRPRAQNKTVQQSTAAKTAAGRGRYRVVVKSVAPSEARGATPKMQAPKSPAQALRDRIRSVHTKSAAPTVAPAPVRTAPQERATKPLSKAEAIQSRVRRLNTEWPKPRNLYVAAMRAHCQHLRAKLMQRLYACMLPQGAPRGADPAR